MMKRTHLAKWFLLILLPAMLCLAGTAVSEAPQRKLTVMVYMCGSNLESAYGSASADIREMKEANVNRQQVGLLVMTGGSNTEGGYFSAQSNRIIEIAGGRERIILEEDAANMGEQETLARFIRYGIENRPAERYALILWDHGGGPLEGACWDETHENDHLSLAEITGALAEAGMEQKLSWIGFDACLMSSLEVAGQLAPYADYMIGSQETEPAFGWNYSFLTGIENDADGAATGRRIVDAYFDGHESSTEILTLACTDLAAVGEAIQAMDPVFAPLSKRLDQEQFLSLSGLRMSTTGFGKAAPEASTTGYDLVDVRDLVSRLGKSEEAEAFLALLDNAVVYSRSNEEGANGLTLYHPYANKDGYSDKWKESYEQLAFSPAYQSYVDAFGGMLTGEVLFRWLDLIPRTPTAQADGSWGFEMPITAEQAENMVSAQLLILRNTIGNQLGGGCVLIASCRAELGEDGVLRAIWDGRGLYAETGSGKTAGPISYLQTDDGKTNTIIGQYFPENDYKLNGQTVLYELDAEDDSEYPAFTRIRVWDEATQSYSSRMTFTEDGFGTLGFWNYHRSLPEAGEDQVLPGFEKWEYYDDQIVMDGFPLPDTWRLHRRPLEDGQQAYAVFRILDSQQNAVCSLPVALPNRYLTSLYPVSGRIETERLEADMYCTVNTSSEATGLQLEWTLKNRTAGKIQVHMENAILNGTRVTNGLLYEILDPGATKQVTFSLGRYDTLLMDTLESIAGMMEITEGGEKQEIPFRFDFDSGDLSALNQGLEVLGEAEQEGISLKLVSVEPGMDTGWELFFLAGNRTGEDYSFGDVLLNGIRIGATFDGALPAGTERFYTVREDNNVFSNTMDMAGIDAAGTLVYLEQNLLQAMGEQELTDVTVFSKNSGEKEHRVFNLKLKAPIPLGNEPRSTEDTILIAVVNPPDSLEPPREDALPVVAENNLFRLRLRRLVAGKESITLSLEWVNLSDEWLSIELSLSSGKNDTVEGLPPNATIITHFDASAENLGGADADIREIGMVFRDTVRDDYNSTASATLVSPEPIRMGQEGGQWINGDRFDTTPARLPDADLEAERNPRTILENLLLPEDPEACRTVIEVPLEPGMEEKIDFCRVAVLRKSDDDFWEILSLNDAKHDGSDVLKIPHPGMIQTVAGFPEIGLITRYKGVDSDTLKGDVSTGIAFTTDGGSIVMCYPIRWELDRASRTAVITEMEQDQTPYTRQWEIHNARLDTMEIRIAPKEDGTLPFIGECEVRSNESSHKRYPTVWLRNRPLQLELRPITKADDLYVMVNLIGKDGTAWSLPVFPYPAP